MPISWIFQRCSRNQESPRSRRMHWSVHGHLFIFGFLSFFYCIHGSLVLDQKQTMASLLEAVVSMYPTQSWDANGRDPCSWGGVNCSSGDPSRVTHLSLSGLGLNTDNATTATTFFNLLCRLDSLRSLDLSQNSLGAMPDVFISNCSGLHGMGSLNLSYNKLGGPLPKFHGFSSLEHLDFSHNSLNGSVGSMLDGFRLLKSLNLSNNMLGGTIPTGLSASMEELFLSRNRFHGQIPDEVFRLRNLTRLDLGQNCLSGKVPDGIEKLSNLETLLLSSNNLSGEIPGNLSMITTLSWFAANQNNFSGTIPARISENLKILDLSFNELSGEIPPNLLSPRTLESLDLSSNRLGGQIPRNLSQRLYRLRLGVNSLNGSIPPEIGKLPSLIYLELNDNGFNGVIPPQLWRCKKLTLLNLASNQLEGSLPDDLGNLSNLVVLQLQMNKFSGIIPDYIFKCLNLSTLNLGHNSFMGGISPTISSLQKLSVLQLEGNKLNGSIPMSIADLVSLIDLQLGNNELSGAIPRMPPSLEVALNLSSNLFRGLIPEHLASLNMLEILDLSNNGFTGNVPTPFSEMGSLTVLVISNNQLSGVLPAFPKWVKVTYTGNNGLMLPNTSLSSPTTSVKKRNLVVIIVAVICSVLGFGLIVALVAFVVSRRFYRVGVEGLPFGESPSQVVNGCFITSNSIHRSSINFTKAMDVVGNPRNIMLKSRFSTYYKAVMPNGVSYSVKKLNLGDKIFQMGSPERFGQEMEVLGKLSSSNVMVPLAYFLSQDSAYLVYENVHKGTLFDFLHKAPENSLDWQSRYSIALGVAQGLTFLHYCTQPLLLLDLTSNSIHLKSLKEPQIGDIELCKIIDPAKSTGSLSTVAGSVGYIPPEYAYTMRVTMVSNVYSFGVVLLELLTGRPSVSKGIELAKWALGNSFRPEDRERILDPSICRTSIAVHSQMLSVLKVALSCVSLSPEGRPKMRNVLRMLFNAK